MAVSNLYDYVSESAYDTYDRMSAFGIRYEAMNPVSSAIAYRARPRPRAGGRGVAPPPRGAGVARADRTTRHPTRTLHAARPVCRTPPEARDHSERTRQCAPL